jgi:hypothetical protein
MYQPRSLSNSNDILLTNILLKERKLKALIYGAENQVIDADSESSTNVSIGYRTW